MANEKNVKRKVEVVQDGGGIQIMVPKKPAPTQPEVEQPAQNNVQHETFAAP